MLCAFFSTLNQSRALSFFITFDKKKVDMKWVYEKLYNPTHNHIDCNIFVEH